MTKTPSSKHFSTIIWCFFALMMCLMSVSCSEKSYREDLQLNLKSVNTLSINAHSPIVDLSELFRKQNNPTSFLLLPQMCMETGSLKSDWGVVGFDTLNQKMVMKKNEAKIPCEPQVSGGNMSLKLSLLHQLQGDHDDNQGKKIHLSINNQFVGSFICRPKLTCISFPIPPTISTHNTWELFFRIAEADKTASKGRPAFSVIAFSAPGKTMKNVFPYLEDVQLLMPLNWGSRRLDCISQSIGQQFRVLLQPRKEYLLQFAYNARLGTDDQSVIVYNDGEAEIVLWCSREDWPANRLDKWTDVTLSIPPPKTEKAFLIFQTDGPNRETKTSLSFWGQPLLIEKRDTEGGAENVLFLLIDTLRSDQLGCYGHHDNHTPELDKLSRTSMIYQNTDSQAPNTLQSLTSLFSGLYPQGGQLDNVSAAGTTHANGGNLVRKTVEKSGQIHQNHRESMGFTGKNITERMVLPGFFQKHGYFTIGISSNPLISRRYHFDRGFDSFNDEPSFCDGSILYTYWYRSLKQAGDKPFFAYIHFMDPHFPYHPPAPYTFLALKNRELFQLNPPPWKREQFFLSLYRGEIEFTDKILGYIFRDLQTLGLDKKTTIIITADHGEEFREHGNIFHNSSLHREQISVPLIIRIVKTGEKGIVAEPVGLIDLFPSILAYFNDNSAEEQEFHGLNNLFHPPKNKSNRNRKPRILMSRLQNYDLMKAANQVSVTQFPWKLIHPLQSNTLSLYKIDEDPQENSDIHASHPNIVKSLGKQAQNYLSSLPESNEKNTIDTEKLKEDLSALGYIETY